MTAPVADVVHVRGKFIRSTPVDTHGTEHRYGCNLPTPTSERSRVPGFQILRCPSCGTVRVTREGVNAMTAPPPPQHVTPQAAGSEPTRIAPQKRTST